MIIFSCISIIEIPNSKHQNANNTQIPKFNDQNWLAEKFRIWIFGHCDLFDICDLLFEIYTTLLLQHSSTPVFALLGWFDESTFRRHYLMFI